MTGQPVCALCGHVISLPRCGHGTVTDESGSVSLCHADDHSCYHRWTVYKERPPGWPDRGPS